MTAQSSETLQRVALLRQKIADKSATLDEMREAVELMRSDRRTAATVSAKSRATRGKTTAAIPDTDSMLDDLTNFG